MSVSALPLMLLVMNTVAVQLTAFLICIQPSGFWHSPVVKGSLPMARWLHSADVIGSNQVYVFGGEDGKKAMNDLHVLNTDKMVWRQLHLAGTPSKRHGHATAVVGLNLFVHGGCRGSKWLDDLHVLDTQDLRWTKLTPDGRLPSPRTGHTLNKVDDKLYLFGGHDGKHLVNTIEVLDLITQTWTQPAISGTIPEGRSTHSMTLMNSSLILFGGWNGSNRFNDLYLFNTVTLTWAKPTVFGHPPPGLTGHSAISINNRLFVFGGYDGRKVSNSLYVLETANFRWLKSQELGWAPSGRAFHSSFLVGSAVLFVFGGRSGTKWLNDLHALYVFEPPSPQNTPEQPNGGSTRSGTREFEKWIAPLMVNTERFGYEVSAAITERQLDDQDRILARLKFPPFTISVEANLEDWIDQASCIARQERLCVRLFQTAWANAADRKAAPYITQWAPPATHEELVDLVAKECFRYSRYVLMLEYELNQGQRQPSVADAERWLKHKLARYLRICKRRNRRVAIDEERIVETLFRCLPEAVGGVLRIKQRTLNLDAILEEASYAEEEHLRLHNGGNETPQHGKDAPLPQADNIPPSPQNTPEQPNGGSTGSGAAEFEKWIAPLMVSTKRFGYAVSTAITERQLDDQDRILARFTFPPFTISDEANFEEWIDQASRIARRERLCVSLFQTAWANVADREASPYITQWAPPATHEELVDLVAMEYFRHSGYAAMLEGELNQGERQPSVTRAEGWLKHKLARYLRICKRRNRRVAVDKETVIETLLRCLPEVVEKVLRMKKQTLDLDSILEEASYEEHLRLHTGDKETPQRTESVPSCESLTKYLSSSKGILPAIADGVAPEKGMEFPQ